MSIITAASGNESEIHPSRPIAGIASKVLRGHHHHYPNRDGSGPQRQRTDLLTSDDNVDRSVTSSASGTGMIFEIVASEQVSPQCYRKYTYLHIFPNFPVRH
jgi:hypothetical protein